MLRPDEVLLWTGAPIRVFRYPRTRSMARLTSLLPWVAIFFVTIVFLPEIVRKDWWWMRCVIVAPIVLILIATYIFEPIRRANRYYAVTNQRAFILARRGKRQPRSASFGEHVSFELIHDFTGAGSIDCLIPGHPDFDYPDRFGNHHEPGLLFEYISDPETVLAIIERQTENASSP